MATGFVNSGTGLASALKPLEKAGNIVKISFDAGPLVHSRCALNQKHQICALPEICC